jgi:hypothetical protein
MPRPRPEDISSAGQDSFLDVVTNIVGILIILVMVVGARVREIVLTPRPQPPAAATDLDREVARLQDTVDSAEGEIEQLQVQAQTVALTAAHVADVRIQLATAVSAARHVVAERKRGVAAGHAAAAEAEARRRRLEEEIERCRLELEGLAHRPAETREVLAYPTPIGRTVNGDEIHFRLAGGRIAYVPLEELFERAKSHVERNQRRIDELVARVQRVGPEQGFMLELVIDVRIDQARGQMLTSSREWVVQPVAAETGETADEALGASSRFRRVLAGVKPDTTVTLWCYPDSFATYRRIREELYRLGIPTAGRPLPEGAPIGGSSEGSKSVVQ